MSKNGPSNPVMIEYAFARLFEKGIGDRGQAWDADVFRSGSVRSIGKLLVKAADQLEVRVGRLRLTDQEEENGQIGARIRVAIGRVRDAGEEMASAAANERESEDYHWEIVGDLVSMVDALLEKLGA